MMNAARVMLPGVPYVWGATQAEVDAAYPCDGAIVRPSYTVFRAIDVEAPAELTYRWLCQLRVAPYSYDALDNPLRRSPRRLVAGLERLAAGQRLMSIFCLTQFEWGATLTLRMRSPLGRAVFGDIAGTYRVEGLGPGRSRLVAKAIVDLGSGPYARAVRRLMPWIDLAMFRKQLRTLKALAETSAEGRGS